jgi:hypothetical protein
LLINTKGAGGGSEAWDYLIGLRCAEKFQKKYERALTARQRQRCLDAFHGEKLTMTSKELLPTLIIHNENLANEPLWNLELSPEDVIETFDEAFKHPLEMVKSEIENLKLKRNIVESFVERAELIKPGLKDQMDCFKRLKPGEKLTVPHEILVSGGSSHHPFLREILKNLCAENDVAPPIFVSDEFLRPISYVKNLIASHGLIEASVLTWSSSSNIAFGAAFALAHNMSPEQFIRRGAAFAIQIQRQPRGRSEVNKNDPWEDTGYVLSIKV